MLRSLYQYVGIQGRTNGMHSKKYGPPYGPISARSQASHARHQVQNEITWKIMLFSLYVSILWKFALLCCFIFFSEIKCFNYKNLIPKKASIWGTYQHLRDMKKETVLGLKGSLNQIIQFFQYLSILKSLLTLKKRVNLWRSKKVLTFLCV